MNGPVLVTGGSRGIGRAIVMACLDRGHDVIAVARASDGLDALAEHGVETRAMDVTDAALCERIADLTALGALINNAGTAAHGPLDATPLDDIDRVLEVNLHAPLRLACAAIPKLSRGGGIVNVTSQMAHVGGPDRSVYCASKAGLEGMTRALAVELAPRGIRVNSVAPTFVETELTAVTLNDPDRRAWVEQSIPLGRLARPEDVADAVVYLLGAGAVTGHSLRVDGGWTAQ